MGKPEETAEYIASHLIELTALAAKHNLQTLTSLLEMAEIEALRRRGLIGLREI